MKTVLLFRKDAQTLLLCGLSSGFVLLVCACILLRVQSAWGFRDCVWLSENSFGPFADSLSSAFRLLKLSASSVLTIHQSVVQDKEWVTLLVSTYHNCYACSLKPCKVLICQDVWERVVYIFVVGEPPFGSFIFYISGLGGIWFWKCAVLKKCLCLAG